MRPYTLPDLDYDPGALEPHISGTIMELHHGKHHAAYVKNANEALGRLDEARSTEDFTRLAALERALAFNLSGHILHSIFWKNLVPQGGDRPGGELARTLDREPLMVIDAWEHAYYLQYQNRKTEFFEAVWRLWSWDDIAARFQAARRPDSGPGARQEQGIRESGSS
jgi:Fe-Mn family superoxide dismutase